VRRDEALRVLGLGPEADARTVRRRFRELARERHPDRGGDPSAFAELRRADAVLRAAPAPARPTVARGRPSRTAPAVAPTTPEADAAGLATALAARAGADGTARLRLVSVAPGARRNRLAAALPDGSIGVLELVTRGPGPDGPGTVEVRLSARGRAARRAVGRLALDDAGLAGTWTRRRVDAAVELRAAPPPSAATVPARTATAAGAAARLLAALGWPAAEWHPET